VWLEFGTRCPTTLFLFRLAVVCEAAGVCGLWWVAFLLVGRSACFLRLLLSRITWISKESEAAAAVGVSVAICWYGSRAGLGRLMDFGGGGSAGLVSSGG